MSSKALTTTVSILDKDYRIACPEEEQSGLRDAAFYLDEKMRDIRNTGKVIGLERIAVMAALNIAHEMLRTGDSNRSHEDNIKRQINEMADKLETALQEANQLEL